MVLETTRLQFSIMTYTGKNKHESGHFVQEGPSEYKGRTNSGVKITIYSTLFLYPEERQIITIGSRLLETQPGDNKEQDAITSNQRDDRQVKGSKIFQ